MLSCLVFQEKILNILKNKNILTYTYLRNRSIHYFYFVLFCKKISLKEDQFTCGNKKNIIYICFPRKLCKDAFKKDKRMVPLFVFFFLPGNI